MSLRIIKAAIVAEHSDDLHLGRLLVLLTSADARKRTAATKAKSVAGIMKLAKLDFLLRYPTCLERVLGAVGRDQAQAGVRTRERSSIETKMIRFRYGPWDPRYRRWLGLLAGRGLVQLTLDGNTVQIGLTDKGRELGEQFRRSDLFAEVARRSDLIVDAVGSLAGTRLKDLIYDTIPEIIDMKWGDEITAGVSPP